MSSDALPFLTVFKIVSYVVAVTGSAAGQRPITLSIPVRMKVCKPSKLSK